MNSDTIGLEKLRNTVTRDLQELLSNTSLSRAARIRLCYQIARGQDAVDDKINQLKRARLERQQAQGAKP